MISYLLSLMLMTGGPVDGTSLPDKEKDAVNEKVRIAEVVPTQVGAQYTKPYRVWPRGSVWVTVGHAQVRHEFNDDGERVPLGTPLLPSAAASADLNGQLNSTVVNLGGKYTFSRIGDMEINGGLNFSMANLTESNDEVRIADQVIVPQRDRSSGFSPQNLTVYGEIQQPAYSMRVGYLADLGPDGSGADERTNTDRQNAFQFGVDGRTYTGPVRVFGGADYFLTLPRTTSAGNDVDLGDVAVLHGGAGYAFGSTEVGLTALYRINREGSPAPDAPLRNVSSGYNLGLVPYVTYTPANAPYQFTLKGALQREYHDYGFALAGRNDIAPRFGVTAGLTYGF